MTGDEALSQLKRFWKDVKKSWNHPHTPETSIQREMVRKWEQVDLSADR
jgi:hypothetical protein